MSNETTTGALSLDHVNILTNDLAACRHFYVDVLHFKEGFRPDFDFPGLWIYLGHSPVLHFIHTDKLQPKNSGAIDHVAFRATNFGAVTKRLKDNGIEFEHKSVPGMELQQIFCYDPHGIKIEFNFHGK
jgi:catechol 2,3-dioxygenase-like lactoylglutathione lyase family enzyme